MLAKFLMKMISKLKNNAVNTKEIYEKYGIILVTKDTKIETGKLYFNGTAKQFMNYIK